MATAGLFNMGGADVEALQRQMDEQRANEFAKMSNTEKLSNLAYTSTAGSGRALLGAFGVDATDPTLRATLTKNRIASEIDYNDHASVQEGIHKLAQAGFVEEARQLATALDVSVKTRAEAAAKTSEKLTPEQKNAAGLADAAGLQRGTAEWTKAYSDALKGLTNKNEPTAVVETADGVFLVSKASGERISRIGSAPERAAKTTVSVDAKGETEFVKELGKLDAKRVNDALTTRDTATSALNSLNKLATLPSDQLITGQFATGRVGATNLLSTLGLASPADAQKLATSQQYQKVAGDVILQTLGGKLGAGFSNADREFIASLVPQLETSPEARRSLIQFMQAKNQDIIKEATRLENYARKNKGLSEFTPTIPMSVTPTGQYSGLSDAELAARIKAAQAQQKR